MNPASSPLQGALFLALARRFIAGRGRRLSRHPLKRPSDLPRLTRELAQLLPGEEPELRRTITIWLRAVLRRTFPGVTIPRMVDLEDAPMLEETALEWKQQYLKEGRQEGMRQLLLQLLE